METLIELYDERPLENVLGVDMFHPKRVVYICTGSIASDLNLQNKLRLYFRHRGLHVELIFYRAGMYDADIESQMKTVSDATGNAWVELSQEDLDRIWAATFEAKADAAMSTASANGKADGMTTILEAAASFTGYDWKH